jgi:hypothetical protein
VSDTDAFEPVQNASAPSPAVGHSDTVVIMQAALPSPLPDKIRESALEIIQSFREKE